MAQGSIGALLGNGHLAKMGHGLVTKLLTTPRAADLIKAALVLGVECVHELVELALVLGVDVCQCNACGLLLVHKAAKTRLALHNATAAHQKKKNP